MSRSEQFHDGVHVLPPGGQNVGRCSHPRNCAYPRGVPGWSLSQHRHQQRPLRGTMPVRPVTGQFRTSPGADRLQEGT